MSDPLVPPQDLAAEEHVLGAILLNSTVIDQFADLLEPDDFYMMKHGKIYEAARDMHNNGDPVDIITLCDQLTERGWIEKVGGQARIRELAATATSARNVGHHANIIRELATLRNLTTASQRIIELVRERDGNTATIVDQAEQLIYNVATRRKTEPGTTIGQAMERAYQIMEQLNESGRDLIGISSGLPELDGLTMGFQRGNLIVVAARPSMGKSALAMGMALHAATAENTPTGFFSIEMSDVELGQRATSLAANVPLQRVRGADKITDTDRLNVINANSTADRIPITLYETSQTVPSIRAISRRLASQQGLGLIVIDYLQLITPSRHYENETVMLSTFTRGLKNVARDLDVPVILLSQLNRNVETRADKHPMLSDLRGSGSIEQDADIVVFVYRDHVYDKSADQFDAELIVAKNRNGQTGTAVVRWDPTRARFHSTGSRHLHAV